DAEILKFSQWWKRTTRVGYGFAHGAYLHGAAPKQLWVWETRRAWLWGILLPISCLAMTALFWPWGLVAWASYPLQAARQTMRNRGEFKQRALLALFQLLARFPECWGQIKFWRDRMFSRQSNLIEYK